MKSFIQLFITALIILLFAYAAVTKLVELSRFRQQLYLQPFPRGLADVLVFAVPLSEILAIALLCTDRRRYAGMWLSLALLVIFTGYIALLLVFKHDHLPCSCGGILNNMSWTTHLLFNGAFITAAITGLFISRQAAETTPEGA